MRRLGVQPIRGQEAPKEWKARWTGEQGSLIATHTTSLCSLDNILVRLDCTWTRFYKCEVNKVNCILQLSYIPERRPAYVSASNFWYVPFYPSRSPKAPPGFDPGWGVCAAGVLGLEAGAPQSPWLVFCLAKSPIVAFCVGVDAFFGAMPPSSEANASPPAFLGAGAPILPPGDMREGVDFPDCGAATEVK
jgi:hypothetical protein